MPETEVTLNGGGMDEDKQRVLSIIDEYETLLWLKHPENPLLQEGETMNYKIERSKKIFVEKVRTGEFNENVMTDMVRKFSLLTLRLGHLLLDLKAKEEVVLVPSKRNYLYAGKPLLIGTLQDLVKYQNIGDEVVINNIIDILENRVSREADYNCQHILEFRLINILIIFISLFVSDKQTISFIAQLFLSQEEIAMGSM